mmetsp:Transcript_71080/g.126543  ORF Transcript_71080/g.126543 Transcript_71080/m.126543 type:complete len:80 (+) Transcript_71080:344-583(+)
MQSLMRLHFAVNSPRKFRFTIQNGWAGHRFSSPSLGQLQLFGHLDLAGLLAWTESKLQRTSDDTNARYKLAHVGVAVFF